MARIDPLDVSDSIDRLCLDVAGEPVADQAGEDQASTIADIGVESRLILILGWLTPDTKGARSPNSRLHSPARVGVSAPSLAQVPRSSSTSATCSVVCGAATPTRMNRDRRAGERGHGAVGRVDVAGGERDAISIAHRRGQHRFASGHSGEPVQSLVRTAMSAFPIAAFAANDLCPGLAASQAAISASLRTGMTASQPARVPGYAIAEAPLPRTLLSVLWPLAGERRCERSIWRESRPIGSDGQTSGTGPGSSAQPICVPPDGNRR